MYENLSGISIEGTIFEGKKNFTLFKKEGENIFPTRFSLVYGKNGSGKSTITKGFQEHSGGTISSIEKSELYDFDGGTIDSTNETKQNIFVFNEDFVENNVKIKKDGLDTIVMFGQQADMEEEIEKINEQILEKRSQYRTQSNKCNEFQDSSNIVAPQYYWQKIKSTLKGDGSWAYRDGKIKGSKVNSSVNKAVIDSIITTKPELTKLELESEFAVKEEEFNHLIAEGEKIQKKVPKVNVTFNIKRIQDLLRRKIEKPELTEREKIILELVLGGQQDHFKKIGKFFTKSEINHCPSCLQPISEDYKQGLVKSISKVLNKNVEKHISELEKAKVPMISLDLSDFLKVDSSEIKNCMELIESVNQVLEMYNSFLQEKIDNTYTPILEELSFLDKIEEVNRSLSRLEKSRIEYNKKFDELSSLKNDLLGINKGIAYYEILDDYNTFVKQTEIKNEEIKSLEVITKEGKELNARLATIQENQKSIRIAVDFINNSLKYVFFSDKRLSIETKNDRYVLFSNGNPVKPQDISCGERNILALCYFFTLTMSNLNEKEFYTKEVLLVIDDPVSSFDLENKVGILSYLKSQLLKVALGNLNSRVVIFTHDLPTIYDLNKQFEEIQAAVKYRNNEKKKEYSTNFSRLELTNFELTNFSYKKRNEYTLMLETIYKYAENGSDDDSLAIGNIMRRALESFATFEYKKGIDSLSCDPDILKSMDNEEYSQYFENLMYRLILHGESHSEEHIKSLQDLNFYSTVSAEEKRRTAKDVLCLINVLNPNHLTAHLSKINNAITDVDSWCTDILSLN